MAQVGNNNVNEFSGQYMVQDSDHMSGVKPAKKAVRGESRQAQQSHSDAGQHGGEVNSSRQQGGERRHQARHQ